MRLVIAAAVAIVVAKWVHIVVSPRGDFHLHWELGRRLAAGEFIYEGGHDCPYPPFWAMVHAPLSLLPMHLAQVLAFPLFLLAAWLLLASLDRLSGRHLPLSRPARFWTAAAAVGLASRFVLRDMSECGVNLALVALSWAAVLLWVRRHDVWAGLALGLAISLKCTPAAFLGYFLWKRQWKVAAVTTLAAAACSLSPLFWMGPGDFRSAAGHWLWFARRGISVADPSQGVLGPEPLQNISLRPALARFLIHLPPGHVGRLDHPLYADFLNLRPETASLVIKALLVGMLGVVAWRFRRPAEPRDQLHVYWECAAVSVLLLLVSPITWGQHCVGVIPAFYLLVRTWIARGDVDGWMKSSLVLYAVVILGLNRTLLGRELSWLLDAYHLHTWCLLQLAAVTLAAGNQAAHHKQTTEDVQRQRSGSPQRLAA